MGRALCFGNTMMAVNIGDIAVDSLNAENVGDWRNAAMVRLASPTFCSFLPSQLRGVPGSWRVLLF